MRVYSQVNNILSSKLLVIFFSTFEHLANFLAIAHEFLLLDLSRSWDKQVKLITMGRIFILSHSWIRWHNCSWVIQVASMLPGTICQATSPFSSLLGHMGIVIGNLHEAKHVIWRELAIQHEEVYRKWNHMQIQIFLLAGGQMSGFVKVQSYKYLFYLKKESVGYSVHDRQHSRVMRLLISSSQAIR